MSISDYGYDIYRDFGVDPDDDDDESNCEVCGNYMDWVECPICGGEAGRFPYEEHPFEYDPDEWEDCEMCRGNGGWLECVNAEHHAEQHHDKYLQERKEKEDAATVTVTGTD